MGANSHYPCGIPVTVATPVNYNQMYKTKEWWNMTTEKILDAVAAFKQGELPRLERLDRYYRGRHDILRRVKEAGKPDNRLVNNFCKSITDSTVGYFIGVPATYSSSDTALEAKICDIAVYNDDAFVNSSLARDLSVFGRAAELLWMDADGMVRYSPVDVRGVIPIWGDTIEGELVGAIRFYPSSDDSYDMMVEYYDDVCAILYGVRGNTAEVCGEECHGFGMVPVNFYSNNRDETGDFENVLTLVDAYNTLQSESVNDFELFADSYLAISGMGGTTRADIEQLRRDRVLLLDDGGDARWLTKPVNDVYIENLKSRIACDIYRFSNTVDMAEEAMSSGQLSGVAIKYRLLSFDNRVSVTEQYFRRGLMRRFELICSLMSALGSDFSFRDVKITFVRNLPGNIDDAASVAVKLDGIISKKTLFELLPFIASPDEELARLSAEDTRPF